MTEKYPWKGSRVNSILYLNDPMPRIERQKENKSQKTPKKAICIKTKYWTILVQDCQSSSPSVRWKINTSLTQKDTMDRGAWIKNFREKAKRRTQNKGQKSKSTKVQNGMGMRNTQIFLFTICYNLMLSKLEATRRER